MLVWHCLCLYLTDCLQLEEQWITVVPGFCGCILTSIKYKSPLHSLTLPLSLQKYKLNPYSNPRLTFIFNFNLVIMLLCSYYIFHDSKRLTFMDLHVYNYIFVTIYHHVDNGFYKRCKIFHMFC